MPLMESNIYAAWVAKQTAKGTPAAAPTKRLIQVGGALNTNPDYGSENYSDLGKFGDSTDWVNSVMANGEPAIEADKDGLAYLNWLFHGAETVTGAVGSEKHAFTPQLVSSPYFTWWQRVGQSAIHRHKHNDCRMIQLQIEGSTAAKAVRVSPTIVSLDPGEIFTSDPTPATLPPSADVFIYTEAEGTFTVGGTVIRAHSQFTLTLNEALDPSFGDSVNPLDFSRGNAAATLGITLKMTPETLGEWNKLVYGTAAPILGAKPLKTVPALSSYSFLMTKAANAIFGLTVPGIRWTPPDAVGPAPDGGETEVAFAGALRKSGVSSLYTIEVTNGVPAYTV